jgi:hypothetical protein
MLTTALALAILTTAGCMAVYKKLPRKVRRFIEKHSLMTDLFTLIMVYTLLGGTLTALMAGAFVGLFVSGLLHISNNPEDFLYLYDLRDLIKEKVIEAQRALNEYGREYREKKRVVDANMPEMQTA